MLSIIYNILLKLILNKTFYVVLGILALIAYLSACSHSQPQRFAAPPQVLVIECDDKAMVV